MIYFVRKGTKLFDSGVRVVHKRDSDGGITTLLGTRMSGIRDEHLEQQCTTKLIPLKVGTQVTCNLTCVYLDEEFGKGERYTVKHVFPNSKVHLIEVESNGVIKHASQVLFEPVGGSGWNDLK